MRYRLQRHDGTDCSATMVPITVLRMVPIQRYRQREIFNDETVFSVRSRIYNQLLLNSLQVISQKYGHNL